MKFDVKIEGIDQAIKNLHALPAIIAERVARSATHAGAKVLFAEVYSRAPVGSRPARGEKPTGPKEGQSISEWIAEGKGKPRYYAPGGLKRSIKVTSRGLSKEIGHYVSVGRFYSRFLEFGTSKMSARPFFRPAVDAAMHRMMSTIVEYFKRNTDRAIKKELKVTKPR